ncbi:MAG: hypothetical protein GF331_22780 [Chitinivibrionales bacterium]|nr:hypothetical protein [Chitinivibrionales bacterium]
MRPLFAIVVICAVTGFAQQPITVLEPNGGETYAVGDTMHIRWEADQSTPLVMLEMSVDAGETWYGVYTAGMSVTSDDWGDYAWVISDSLTDVNDAVSTVSADCMIRVRNYVDQVTNDVSDGVFSVVTEAGVRDRPMPLMIHRGKASPATGPWVDLCGRVQMPRVAAGVHVRSGAIAVLHEPCR